MPWGAGRTELNQGLGPAGATRAQPSSQPVAKAAATSEATSLDPPNHYHQVGAGRGAYTGIVQI